MPTYDYACSGCGHRFERFEPIGEVGPKECPKCHKKKAKRMLGTGAGLIFKGSGFYSTDYKRSGGEAKDKGSGAKDSDKKPAAKEAKEKKKEEPKK